MAGTLGNYDINPDGGARNVSGYITGAVLSSGAHNMVIPTVGTGVVTPPKRVILSYTNPICIDFAKTAVVPGNDDTGVKSELLQGGIEVESRTFIIPVGATNLSVIAADNGASLVTASWFY